MPFFSTKIMAKFTPDFSDLSLADLKQIKRDLRLRKTRARIEISKKIDQLKALNTEIKKEKNTLLVFKDEARIEEDQRLSTLADILADYSVDDYIIKNQLLNYSPYAICESKCKPVEDKIQSLLKDEKTLQQKLLGLKNESHEYRSQMKLANESIDNLSNASGMKRSL